MHYAKKYLDYIKKILANAFDSKPFLVSIGFLAGVFFDPIAVISSISNVGWFFIGVFTLIVAYVLYAYHKINEDSFD